MSVSTDDFRRALGSFASGVTIVTAMGSDSRPAGVTVSAFSSLSLDPPLVLVCLDKRTAALDVFQSCQHFAINILADDQTVISNTFASPEPDRFAGVATTLGVGGSPLIDGAIAQLECRQHALHDGGDHIILVGAVEQATSSETKEPLLYARGRYCTLV